MVGPGSPRSFARLYLLAALWSLQVLAYKVRGYPLRAILESIARVVLAGILAAEAAWWVARRVGGNSGADALLRLLAASATIAAGVHGGAVRARRSRARFRTPARQPAKLGGTAPTS